MAESASVSKKSLENRLLGFLVGLSIVAGLGVFAYSRGLYYYVQYFWDDLFGEVQKFGEDCEAGVGDWVPGDTFQSVVGRPPALKRMRMPYYSAAPAEKPDVGAGQFLYTRCQVDLGKLKPGGFGWMRLHFVHGDTAIFLNDVLKQTVDDLGIAEFPLTTADRQAASTLVLVSRPNALKSKLLGLPTSMPLIFTDSRAALAKPNFGALFDFTLRPTYWLNEALVFLLIFAVAWLGGMRREDIAWLAVAMASSAIMDFAIFSKTNASDPTWRSVSQVAAFSVNVALCCFALAFTGARIRFVKPVGLYLVAMFAYGPLCFLPRGTISSAYLLFYVPMWVQFGLYGSVAAVSFKRRNEGVPFDYPRRLAFVAWFCAVLAVVKVLDLLMFRQLGFTFAEAITEVGMTGFCIFLIFDLVVSYRKYLAEKLLRLETETRSREFEAVARVTQMLAHDVRKPYQTLLNGLKVLDAEMGKGEASQAAKRVRGEVERALGETNAMLSDVMDMGAKQSEFKGEVDVRSLAEECVNRAVDLNQKKGIKVLNEWSGPTKLAIDPRRFQRVLMNLIENAVQATPPGGTLKLGSAPAELEGKSAVRLTVWNSGSFIPEEDRARIFDPFFTKNKSRGTGLGLAIVRKFIEAEGGRIACRSVQGEGTAFDLTLPVAVTGAPGRLAVIDDDVFAREIWQSVGGGWTVTTFDGPAGFWKAAGGAMKEFLASFDVIMTDYYFGKDDEGTGESFAKDLKERGTSAKVVLFSDVVLPPVEMAVFDNQIAKMEQPTPELLNRLR